jgi:hypothetical protein
VDDWLSRTPLLVLGVAAPILMALAVAVGMAIRRWTEGLVRSGDGAASGEGLEGYMIQAVLGLLALLMAFTFALAIDRFETRRRTVLEEANAIGTIYLRVQLLQQPHRDRLSRLLVDYTDNRVRIAKASPAEVRRLLPQNDLLLTDLWAATVAAFDSVHDAGLSNALLTGMNSLIDMDGARKAARMARVPTSVFFVLFVYLIVTAGLMGYVFVGQRGRVTAAFWLALLTLFLLLVFDIDRPNSGVIRESQAPMELLQASFATQPPKVFDRYRRPAPAP